MNTQTTRRGFLAGTIAGPLYCSVAWAQKQTIAPKHPPSVKNYLNRLYAEGRRKFAFRENYSGGFERWQTDARPVLKRLIGLKGIAASIGDHVPRIELGDIRDMDRYTFRPGSIETEPDVRIPFWLLRPKGPGPHPLAILPHGHDRVGHDTHAGVYRDEAHRRKALSGQRNVAVQAVERGFVAIAPATRGLAVDGVPDIFERHGERDCRSQLMHCLLAGRTAIGEPVWDLRRLLDWAVTLPEIDTKHVLMMGNSGGGMATLYTAACDERISVAVPSCSFTTIAGPDGRIYHCDCNMVPGILEWGDLYDVAGLIAPRWLLAVNGRKDKLHESASIEQAAARARAIYRSAGHSNRFDHRWGSEGHRFYSDLMWPFVMQSVKTSS